MFFSYGSPHFLQSRENSASAEVTNKRIKFHLEVRNQHADNTFRTCIKFASNLQGHSISLEKSVPDNVLQHTKFLNNPLILYFFT